MGTKKFFILLMIMFMLFAVSGCGGSGSNTQTFSNNPISPDKPAPAPETKSDDIPTVPVPEPYPQSQDKPISNKPIPTPTDPIISLDPIPVGYTVSFNSNGGSTVPSITVQSGHTISKPRKPTKYGCTFKGWYKDSALTQIFTFGADGDKVTANITLYAKWIEDSVLAEIAIEKVSIGYQDGDSANYVTKNITLPRNIDVSGDVANIIWSSNNEKAIYTNGTVTRQSTDVTVVLTALASIGTADKSRVFTLKVIHAEIPVPSSYTVSFNTNGGSAVSSITVPSGNTVTQPATPSRNGYTFGGWYKDSALTQAFKFGSNGDKVTSNITLYAKWIETDRLRAETAIGKVSIGYQEGDSASSVTKNLTLPTSVNASGDVNISWSSNNLSVISNSGIVIRPSKDDVIVVLTAKVTVGSVSRTKNFTITVIHEATPESSGYTVSFDSNGGSSVASIHVSSGGTVAMPENPTRTGYVFAGWYKDKEFTEIFMFGTDGDKITKDTTLYAQWLDSDLLVAEYATDEIVIGYANGDNPKHVTRNLILPAKIGSADISWISNSNTVDSDGKVTRQAEDIDVKLTATATYNGKSADPRTFAVKVIRRRTRDNSSIKALSIEEASSGDIEVTRNDSGDITDIEGQYVSFNIRNADDALDAVTVLRDELGIRSPEAELETFLVTSDTYSSEYAFSQIHKGIRVWGRKLVVSANSVNKVDFLHSSFLSSDVVAKADGKNDIGRIVAEESAKNHYTEEVEADTERTEKIIYSLDDYANNPACAYIVRICSISVDNQIDDTVFVNADTGEIIMRYPNICSARDDICSANGKDELGNSVSFEVMRRTTLGFIPTYVMSDPNLHVVMRSNMYLPILGNKNVTLSGKLVESSTNTWTDGQEVSAYSNMREIMKWWKKRFGRDGLDDKGSTVNVIAHAWGGEDNAGWEYHAEAIYVYDRAEVSKLDHSYAVAVDMLTHETTHGVLQYITGNLPYRDAIGAINEAYADILACVRDENWKMGEGLFDNDNAYKLNCIRNIADPRSTQAKEKPLDGELYSSISDIYQRYIDYAPDKSNDYNYVHKRSFKVSHAAYLMHESNDPNGLTWKELGDIWYKSMHKGLDATSRFEDVQRCVLEAAKEVLPKSSQKQKLDVIKSAFSQLGYGSKATLTGIITDYDTALPIVNAQIVVNVGKVKNFAWTNENGHFSIDSPEGNCYIEITHADYTTFEGNMKLSASAPWGGNVLNVKLVKPGSGSLSGRIVRLTIPPKPAPNVTLKIRSGWNNQDSNPILTATTDSNGNYAFNLGENGAGYYTVEMIGSGYEAATFNVTVSGQTEWQDEYINGGEDEPDDPTPTSPDIPTPVSPDVPIVYDDIPIDEEHFPDDYFRLYVIRKIDRNQDRILNKTEIENTVEINTWGFNGNNSSSIQSLKGIEYFVFLQSLDCGPNLLRTLDVSACTSLQTLTCDDNLLTTLDVSGCTSLKTLECGDNPLMTTLNVSGCTSLQQLKYYNNPLTILNASGCTSLQQLKYYNNNRKLTTLDVSGCTSLKTLECEDNPLMTTLNVRGCTSLQTLKCEHNLLTTLDVSDCISLQMLGCGWNQLTTLDVSRCNNLQILGCQENQITMLDVSNCTALQGLVCFGNQLVTLDVSRHIALQDLRCYHNRLTTLDASGCATLQELRCDYNQLTTLDVSGCIALQELRCNDNQLTTLDVSECTALQELHCNGNQLTTLNVIGCTNLQKLYCYGNKLTAIDLSNCPNIDRYYFYHDRDIIITWPSYETSTASHTTSSQSGSFTSKPYPDILAILPAFTPAQSGIHTFTVSLDREPPESTSLVLLSDSEDIHGSFTLTDLPDIVRVSADFMAGRTYAPVIVAMSEGENQGGGCNAGNIGIILLAGFIVALAKGHDTEGKK